MIKVFFYLSFVVMGVACFFAYQNNRAFAIARDSKATTHQTLFAPFEAHQCLVKAVEANVISSHPTTTRQANLQTPLRRPSRRARKVKRTYRTMPRCAEACD
jgi:hypothetical protein